VELKLAVKKGYKIIDIYEVWNFEKISGGENEESNLFSEFINDCIKEKVESSDFPKPNMTSEEKRNYINDYKIHEGIELNLDSICLNPGKRAASKLRANSFWGKNYNKYF
jgi:hypothetical protein